MGHSFGNLLSQYRDRKHGLSQTRLAQLAGYHPAVLVRMCQGKKDLTVLPAATASCASLTRCTSKVC